VFSKHVEVRYCDKQNHVSRHLPLSFGRQFLPLELQNGFVFCSFFDNNVKSVGELRHAALVPVWSGTEPFPLCRATQAQRYTAILCINSLQVLKIVPPSLSSLKMHFLNFNDDFFLQTIRITT